jgi:hypothetical protein
MEPCPHRLRGHQAGAGARPGDRRAIHRGVAPSAPSSRGGAGAGGGAPRLCRDGGGAEEGAHPPLGLGRAAQAGRSLWMCSRAGGVEAGFRVWAYVKGAGGVRAMVEHRGLPTASAHRAPARGPPQSAGCGSSSRLSPPREPGPCRAPAGKAAGLGRCVSAGDERLLGVRLMGSPSASLSSRSAPARYAQEGSCPSYALTVEA